MTSSLESRFPLVADTYRITRPYGRRRLVVVFCLILMQALMQVVGVGSVYPFLALATDPAQARESAAGAKILSYLPAMTDAQLLLWAGIGAITLLFLSNATNLLSEIGRVRYARGFGHWLSVRLLRQITSRPYGYFLERNTGELFKKVLTDVPAYVGVLVQILEVGARTVTSLVLVVFLVLISPAIALGATLLFGTFYGLAFFLLRGLRQRISKNLKSARRGASREATQLLGAIKPVKVHDVRDHFLERFSKHSQMQAREAGWIPLIGNATRYVVEPLAFGGLVALVLVMAQSGQPLTELMPTLGVMALAGYRLLPSLQALYNSLNSISTHRHAVDEVAEEFVRAGEEARTSRRKKKSVSTPAVAVPQLSSAIEIRNLTFAYANAERPVIEDLSFSIPANSSFAIVGRTGSGKSTLVDVILGLHTPTSGSVLVDGVRITSENLADWRTQIGYVPQEIFLLDDTVAANIAFGVPTSEIDPTRLRESAERAQILDFIESELPGGFDAMVGERGVRLSGGQRQRIGLARALYRRPRVLVLDEATSALDTETENALVDALDELHGELTMIVIAHRLSTIEGCERKLDLSEKFRPSLMDVV